MPPQQPLISAGVKVDAEIDLSTNTIVTIAVVTAVIVILVVFKTIYSRGH